MTKEEKKIESAAQLLFEKILDSDDFKNAHGFKEGYILGAKSEVAKLYWLEKLSAEFESKEDNKTIQIIEVINKVLKSDMAKEYWTEGMYSEKQIRELLIECDGEGGIDYFEVEKWFKNNK